MENIECEIKLASVGTLTRGVENYRIRLPKRKISVSELIAEKVYQEVSAYNSRARANYGREYLRNEEIERMQDAGKIGLGSKRRRQVDPEVEYQKALQAFEQNVFLILVDGRQRELGDIITVTPQTNITFIRLVPLVGG